MLEKNIIVYHNIYVHPAIHIPYVCSQYLLGEKWVTGCSVVQIFSYFVCSNRFQVVSGVNWRERE